MILRHRGQSLSIRVSVTNYMMKTYPTTSLEARLLYTSNTKVRVAMFLYLLGVANLDTRAAGTHSNRLVCSLSPSNATFSYTHYPTRPDCTGFNFKLVGVKSIRSRRENITIGNAVPGFWSRKRTAPAFVIRRSSDHKPSVPCRVIAS